MKKIKQTIENNNIFLILPHISPDGDATGSSIALCEVLRKSGKDAYVVSIDSIPRSIRFLADGYVDSVESFKCKLSEKGIDKYVVLILDCGDIMRIEDRKDLLDDAITTINIDHHITNTEFADINLVDKGASSTGELIYKTVKEIKLPLTPLAIDAFYTSIASDTGGFRYANASAATMGIVAELLALGANSKLIGINLFQNKPLSVYKAIKVTLDNLRMFNDGKIALSYFTSEDMTENEIGVNDIDGMAELLRDIDTVEVSAVLRYVGEDTFKVSMRSKEYVDLSKVAYKFDGGGHVRAAGCKMSDTLEVCISKLISAISEEMASVRHE